MKFLRMHLLIKNRNLIYIVSICLLLCSCAKEHTVQDANVIYLKWNKSYEDDTIEKHKIGLTWALSFLGSDIALDTDYKKGISDADNVIQLDITKVGFSEKAITHLQSLHQVIKQSEEYQKKGNIDLGRYLALTIGSPNHYYKIVDVPLHLYELESKYTFDTLTAYINNSSISKIDREIQYSIKNNDYKRAFISTERDTITGEIKEYETVELMENGLSRFALYDLEGNLKVVGDENVTRAGKPAKCMWCHESHIQPLFRKQIDVKNHLPSGDFLDSLERYDRELKAYQNRVWQNTFIKKRQSHTEMELAYITFMEPSVEQLANEWQIPLEDVQKKVAHLKSHLHHEFQFLGDLYYRKDVDVLAPFKVIEVPEYIREASDNEHTIDYIK